MRTSQHAGQKLRQARIRLALFLDRRDELAVLQLDAVHAEHRILRAPRDWRWNEGRV